MSRDYTSPAPKMRRSRTRLWLWLGVAASLTAALIACFEVLVVRPTVSPTLRISIERTNRLGILEVSVVDAATGQSMANQPVAITTDGGVHYAETDHVGRLTHRPGESTIQQIEVEGYGTIRWNSFFPLKVRDGPSMKIWVSKRS